MSLMPRSVATIAVAAIMVTTTVAAVIVPAAAMAITIISVTVGAIPHAPAKAEREEQRE
ncbi:hypothetical protein [Acidocella sp.]|uniref:hypothetical protein n=1 Tax=Acidocella sp. TaxID=50710 RepID=UPI00262A7FB0|nr:hypothetical protein [Acidocella sp.]